MRKKKVDEEPKYVAFTKCTNPHCESTDPPVYMCTDVHVTWGTTLVDGKIHRNKGHRDMAESDKDSYLLCSKCGTVLADNIRLLDGMLVRNPDGGRK